MSQVKLIVCDYDGVLQDCKDMHYESLNKALLEYDPSGQYVIGREEHLSKYDGLNTTAKLKMLSREKGLIEAAHLLIYNAKQKYTRELINEMQVDVPMKLTLRKLKEDGYTIAVASNSIRDSLKMMLVKRGFMEYIDFYYSNEDVRHPKPSTEIYLKCMIKANVSPKETLILEDSQHGRRAALASGAHLMGVKNTSDVTYNNIKSMIGNIQTHFEKGEKWQDKRLNVLIPLAGRGSRFEQAGYTFPKPLIEVHGKPMIQLVVENLNIDAHFIFVVQKDHYEKYNLRALLNLIAPGCDIIITDGITEGAACTTLLAKSLINNDEPLLLANSDQFLVWDSFDFMYSMIADSVDGGIVTFKNTHPKWSFAEVNKDGFVTKVAEKEPISDNASTGIYYYSKGSDYVTYAEFMISKNGRVNGEFYVCPVFNVAVTDGKKIKNYHIDEFYGIGTPEDLNYFINNYKK
jgi:HAD superfamily hydrolase (TIGR01509 family)